MTELDVEKLLADPAIDVIVCCGSGGVGKTTLSAALGVRAAMNGRRVVTLTIDPARRLAQALGLEELDNTPRKVAIGKKTTSGELHAMQLDMKRTFDEVVEAHASTTKAAQILANPFYQSLSSSFAGTQEYMAMEKLGQLRASGRWDLIIVDTPPARSALDFLDAPRRLARFLDGRFIRMLLVPAKAGGRGYAKVVHVGLGIVTGPMRYAKRRTSSTGWSRRRCRWPASSSTAFTKVRRRNSRPLKRQRRLTCWTPRVADPTRR